MLSMAAGSVKSHTCQIQPEATIENVVERKIAKTRKRSASSGLFVASAPIPRASSRRRQGFHWPNSCCLAGSQCCDHRKPDWSRTDDLYRFARVDRRRAERMQQCIARATWGGSPQSFSFPLAGEPL